MRNACAQTAQRREATLVSIPPREARRPVKVIRRRLDLLVTLVGRDLKLRYKRSFLGIAWSLVTPLLQLAVYHFVFTRLLPLGIPDYAAFLFVGILAWGWLQGSLTGATTAILDARDLVTRPGFPSSILPWVVVAANLVDFVVAFPVLIVFLAAGETGFGWPLAALPVLVSAQFLFTLGLAYLVSALHVHFRDTQHLLGVVLTLGFFLTPVFYRTGTVPEAYLDVYLLNPMVHLVDGYREVLLHGAAPGWTGLAGVGAVSALLLLAGYGVFRRASATFVEQL